MTASSPLTFTNVQSILLGGGLRRLEHVSHLLITVTDPAAGKRFLRDLTASPGAPDDLRLTTGPAVEATGAPHERHVAVGFTADGLRLLGVLPPTLRAFPPAFREGAVSRANRTGDVGTNAPANWIEPFAPDPSVVHLVLSVWSRDPLGVPPLDDGLAVVKELVGKDLHDGSGNTLEPFGFRDGITNPQFVRPDRDDYVPPGEFLLGYEGQFGDAIMRLPYAGMSEGIDGFGHDGTFAALRIMEQDVSGFHAFLATGPGGLDQEALAGLLCGRRRDGSHLGRGAAPDGAEPDFRDDPDGRICPVGSHIRRANPRSGPMVSQDPHRRRLIRRGKPYADPPDAAQPLRQGLLGYFLCSSLAAQYEALLHDWISVGLQHPSITGTNDPLVGVQPAGGGAFRFHHPDHGDVTTIQVPQFVVTKGVMYLFLPGGRAVRRLAEERTL